jgi:uncharacterized YccA/Bax inhibitor family protein
LKEATFRGLATAGEVMTLEGTVNRCYVLLLLLLAGAAATVVADRSAIGGLVVIGALGGLVVAIATVIRKQWAPVTAPLYALLEGLVVGGVSIVFDQAYPGIALTAVALTLGTLFALLTAYRSRLIQATENFKLGVVAATGGVAIVYVAQLLLSLFGAHVAFLEDALFGSGILGIGVSAVVVVIAALNLVLDFDFIENGVTQGAPKYMEWYGAFGLLVTLVWLYLEILRLLAKLRSDD